MLIESVFYLVAPRGRPPYGQFADHLWGSKANIDSDGNSRTPDDTQWIELSLVLRGSEGEAEIHIDPVAGSPLILKIRSPNAGLSERTAIFLSDQTAGSIEPSLSGGQSWSASGPGCVKTLRKSESKKIGRSERPLCDFFGIGKGHPNDGNF